ncbi:MAG: hypothetical protein EA383_15795 [Spirochaetaceae bacterium]|nr:MAG: hypothetical protein EA383_15795 [Spirochaetaceae bacterium]
MDTELEAMILPENFDPEASMPATRTEHGVFHVTREAAGLARRLVANGSSEDMKTAERVYEALLACQEVRPGHLHFGNFTWMAEDDEVEDLNAVEFVLTQLIGTLRSDAEKLRKHSEALFERLLQSVRDGLAEIARLDVHPGYTNICVLDIVNTCLGAELLGDEKLFLRGARKLGVWTGFTIRSGHVMEFNSPTYLPICIEALTELSRAVQNSEVRALASAAARRLVLSAGLRLHRASGRWAGPHGRGYASSTALEASHRETQIVRMITEGPHQYISEIAGTWNGAISISETASIDQGLQFTSYLSDSFSLGTALKPFMSQSNVMLAYIADPSEPGRTRNVVYSRYLTNDQWYGDFYHDTDRSNSRNLLDEGQFIGLQDRGVVLGAYAPGGLESVSAAAAYIIIADADAVDQILVNDEAVDSLPYPVDTTAVIGFQIADTCIALRCAELTALGADAGVCILRRGASLVVEFLQYRGQKKTFWETRAMAGFFKGKPAVAFALSFAERKACGTLNEHMARMASLYITSEAAPPGMYDGTSTRKWNLKVEDPDCPTPTIEMNVDLFAWKLLDARLNDHELGWPMIDLRSGPVSSVRCTESVDGSAELESLRAVWKQGSVWLMQSEDHSQWACGWINPHAIAGTLSVRAGDADFVVENTIAGFLRVRGSIVEVDEASIDAITVPDGYELGRTQNTKEE